MNELDLMPFPFSAVVIHNEEEHDEFCKARGFKDATWIDENTNGDVGVYGSLAVVRFNDLAGMDINERAGVYSHEATHVFQALCVYISENEPSDEFQAHYIGRLTSWLYKESECYLASNSSSLPPSSSSPSSAS